MLLVCQHKLFYKERQSIHTGLDYMRFGKAGQK